MANDVICDMMCGKSYHVWCDLDRYVRMDMVGCMNAYCA